MAHPFLLSVVAWTQPATSANTATAAATAVEDDCWILEFMDGELLISQSEVAVLSKNCNFLRLTLDNSGIFKVNIGKKIDWTRYAVDTYSAQILLTLVMGQKIPLEFLWARGVDGSLNTPLSDENDVLDRANRIIKQILLLGDYIGYHPFFPEAGNNQSNVLSTFDAIPGKTNRWSTVVLTWWHIVIEKQNTTIPQNMPARSENFLFDDNEEDSISNDDRDDDVNVDDYVPASSIALKFSPHILELHLIRLFDDMLEQGMLFVRNSCVENGRPYLLPFCLDDNETSMFSHMLFTSFGVGPAVSCLCTSYASLCQRTLYAYPKEDARIKVTMLAIAGTHRFVQENYSIDTETQTSFFLDESGTQATETLVWCGPSNKLSDVLTIVKLVMQRTPPGKSFSLNLQSPSAALLEHVSCILARAEKMLVFHSVHGDFLVNNLTPLECFVILQEISNTRFSRKSEKLHLLMELK